MKRLWRREIARGQRPARSSLAALKTFDPSILSASRQGRTRSTWLRRSRSSPIAMRRSGCSAPRELAKKAKDPGREAEALVGLARTDGLNRGNMGTGVGDVREPIRLAAQ